MRFGGIQNDEWTNFTDIMIAFPNPSGVKSKTSVKLKHRQHQRLKIKSSIFFAAQCSFAFVPYSLLAGCDFFLLDYIQYRVFPKYRPPK